MGGNLHAYNWEAAFVAYCNGAPEDEISQLFDIPLTSLRKRMARDGWAGLRNKLPLAQDKLPLPAKVNAKLEAIEENRRVNLDAFVKLREHAVEMVTALRDGRLKVQKQFHNKGLVVTTEAAPGPGDWLNIATYLRMISEGTYRALGDFQAQEKSGQDTGAAAVPAAPAITIILPHAIAAPREKRVSEGHVIDLS